MSREEIKKALAPYPVEKIRDAIEEMKRRLNDGTKNHKSR
jgi:hypothetical protein